MMMRTAVTAFCLCLALPAMAADVYKWTDAQGHVHYGDQPTATAQKVITDTNTDAGPKEDPAVHAHRVEECGRKRDQLGTYQGAARIVEKDALGNEKEYSDVDRKKLIEITQKQIDDGCQDIPAEPAKAPAAASPAANK
jgi:hypothetical protein